MEPNCVVVRNWWTALLCPIRLLLVDVCFYPSFDSVYAVILNLLEVYRGFAGGLPLLWSILVHVPKANRALGLFIIDLCHPLFYWALQISPTNMADGTNPDWGWISVLGNALWEGGIPGIPWRPFLWSRLHSHCPAPLRIMDRNWE